MVKKEPKVLTSKKRAKGNGIRKNKRTRFTVTKNCRFRELVQAGVLKRVGRTLHVVKKNH